MSTLLENLVELVKMIFGVIVTPNYGSQNPNFNLLRWIFRPATAATPIRSFILLSFGILLAGVSIGILKRFLWKS